MGRTAPAPCRPTCRGSRPGSCAITPSAGIAAGAFAGVLDVLAYVSLGAKDTADRPT